MFSLEAAGQVFRFLVLDLTGQTEKKKTNEAKKTQNDPHLVTHSFYHIFATFFSRVWSLHSLWQAQNVTIV